MRCTLPLFSALLLVVQIAGADVTATQLTDLVRAGDQSRVPSGRMTPDPFSLPSEDSLISYLEVLTTIRPNAGWRTSATSGEAEAISFVAGELAAMTNLQAMGLELERQPFHTYFATELRTTQIHLRINGTEIEVASNGIIGHRDFLSRALRFDSDGTVNDNQPDPVVVDGAPVLILSAADIPGAPADLQGQIALVDYELLDRAVLASAGANAARLLARQPAGIVPITSYSNSNGESHGSFAGFLPIWTTFDQPLPVILTVRLEDLEVAGITDWQDLETIDAVRMTWDADVFSPGSSENLIARIPGVDSDRAMILSAHIDSPNSPGGLDDGSGTVAILEAARVINAVRNRPAVDLYLVWYGSHERGLYGSGAFVAAHQELIDRTIAMLQVDSLSVPLDGIDMFRADMNPLAAPYGVEFQAGAISGGQAQRIGVSPLFADIIEVELIAGNGVPFTITGPQVLATAGSDPVVALVEAASGGEVLVIADLGILGAGFGGPANLDFWRNLANYAQRR